MLVLVHEFGHFAVAKWAGVAVQEFGVGFPPRIGSIVFRGTRYSLNWIPLGGFVKLLGEDGEIEVQRLRERGLSDAAIEKVMEGALSRRRIRVRLAVLLAGVLMNFMLGALLFAMALSQPTPEYHGPVTITSIQAGQPGGGHARRRGRHHRSRWPHVRAVDRSDRATSAAGPAKRSRSRSSVTVSRSRSWSLRAS